MADLDGFLCAACGLPIHRYSPNFPGHQGRANLMGCVNSLRGEVERLRAAIAEHREAVETDTGLDPKFYEADDRRLWSVLDEAMEGAS